MPGDRVELEAGDFVPADALPFARPVFETAAHFGWEWALPLVLALTPVTVIEVTKLIQARVRRPELIDQINGR